MRAFLTDRAYDSERDFSRQADASVMMQKLIRYSPGTERAEAVFDRTVATSTMCRRVPRERTPLPEVQRSREELCRQLSILRGSFEPPNVREA